VDDTNNSSSNSNEEDRRTRRRRRLLAQAQDNVGSSFSDTHIISMLPGSEELVVAQGSQSHSSAVAGRAPSGSSRVQFPSTDFTACGVNSDGQQMSGMMTNIG